MTRGRDPTPLFLRASLVGACAFVAAALASGCTVPPLASLGDKQCDLSAGHECTDPYVCLEGWCRLPSEGQCSPICEVGFRCESGACVGDDRDGDGRTGSDDCDDNDPERFTGNAESCASPKDNNCSQSTGCADSACTGPCAAGGIGACSAGVCTGVSELSCVDGADNDADGLIDCADQDCLNAACDDGNACTTGSLCLNGSCAAGAPVSCPAPDLCHDAGTCAPASGCSYPTIMCIPNECQTGGACTLPTGCSFTARPDGTACSGGAGLCAGGACAKNVRTFPFTPSNFVADGGGAHGPIVIDCAAVLDTSGATPTLLGCGDAGFASAIIVQGGISAVLIETVRMVVTDGGSLRITGSRPAIFAVYGDAVLGGQVDVSAAAARSGPGANLSCSAAGNGAADTTNSNGGSGAGGAGFAAAGGKGGDAAGAVGGAGGLSSGSSTLSPLRGGCPGGRGSALVPPEAAGGGGGGALQISAAGVLRINGRLHANGGGGQGALGNGNRGDGAGGGGSGGGILLEAGTLTLTASSVLTASGGTGGEGGDHLLTSRGQDGLDGTRGFGPTTAPQGTFGEGGKGGNGGGGNVLSGGAGGTPTFSRNGAGGGGGAAGRIRLSFSQLCRESGHLISPSTDAVTPGENAAFTANNPLTAAVTSCP